MSERNLVNECYYCRHAAAVPGNTHIQCRKPDPKMTGQPHGIKCGWFYYPLLFDPCWKERLCSNYEEQSHV